MIGCMDTSAPQTIGQSAPSESQTAPAKAVNSLAESVTFPISKGWVSDYESLLTEAEIQSLTNKIKEFEEKTSNEVAILTYEGSNTAKPYHQWLSDIANEWGIGKKEKDNGVLIGVNISKRQLGIATGLGIEEILTDQKCQKIVDEVMIPFFKDDKPFLAFDKTLDEIFKQLN